jgi:hypothetical protein
MIAPIVIGLVTVASAVLKDECLHVTDSPSYSSNRRSIIGARETLLGSIPNIAGLDWLGWAIDLKQGTPEEGLKFPLFRFTFNGIFEIPFSGD